MTLQRNQSEDYIWSDKHSHSDSINNRLDIREILQWSELWTYKKLLSWKCLKLRYIHVSVVVCSWLFLILLYFSCLACVSLFLNKRITNLLTYFFSKYTSSYAIPAVCLSIDVWTLWGLSDISCRDAPVCTRVKATDSKKLRWSRINSLTWCITKNLLNIAVFACPACWVYTANVCKLIN